MRFHIVGVHISPLRPLGALAAAAALALAPAAGTALALAPPGVDPGALVLNAPVAPPDPTEQHLVCSQPSWTGAQLTGVPPAQKLLDLPEAWQFSRGAGQTVAVIDTGVNRHPRLPHLIGGGDYVSHTDGTSDCDGHGTLVAGIIGGAPGPNDGFSGVAPDATILSIRQTSLAFQASGLTNQNGTMSAGGYGTVTTLANAVVHAVRMGATVINISEVSCRGAGDPAGDRALGAALKYAFDHNVVVVASAGNLENSGACKEQNGTGWDGVKTVPSPAWFAQYVLSVAAVENTGAPSSYTLYGPWVGVAAPGNNLVSLDSAPGGTGLVNGIPQQGGAVAPIDGTSFSSAYVAGLAALVRARFPQLGPRGVMDRIERTAHAPGTGRDDQIGSGTIDPTAALTAVLTGPPAPGDAGRAIAGPLAPMRVSPWPARIGLAGAVTCLGLLGIFLAVSIPSRRRQAADRADLFEDLP